MTTVFVAKGDNPDIDDFLKTLGLNHVSEFSFHFKKGCAVTVTATMNIEEDAVKKLFGVVKKYQLVEIKEDGVE